MKVYVMNIQKACESAPPELREETECIKNKRRKMEIIAGRMLLHKAFAERGANVPPVLKKGKNGKPLAENGICFNVSHDGDFVVCACGNTEVGADIVKTERFSGKKASRIFTEKEKALVENDVVKTALLWSCKEAFVKMTGEGLSAAENAPDFSELLCDLPRGKKCGDSLFYSFESDGYIITVCTREPVEISFVLC